MSEPSNPRLRAGDVGRAWPHLPGAWGRFFAGEEAPTATEYAVMLALITVVAIAAIAAMGRGVSSTFRTVSDSMGPGAEGN